MMPMTAPDYYALDDTRAGRITQAALAGSLVAVHDWAPSKRAARLWQAGILTSGLALVAYLNQTDENPDNDLENLAEVVSPAKTWGILLGGGVAATAFLTKARAALARAGSNSGVRHPNTWIGAVVAGGVFVASEVAAGKKEPAGNKAPANKEPAA